MAATKPPLQLVLEKANRQQQAISERLEKALNVVRIEKEQLEKLQEYESDYLQKIKTQQANLSVDHINRYRSFCYQLSDVLKGQQKKVQLEEQKVHQLRQQLSLHQHKISVLKDLLERQRTEERNQEDKLLQKETDELSIRRHY